ncbi:hypothetical protein BKA82DRAFT_4181809 [Pisolithus tinctorius]|nr:hypothetical protein BKA82DRAFT_4181809 [Pisolithus tinctorius]
MGAEDVWRQALNIFHMKMLGTKVMPVQLGSKTLKDAVNEAIRLGHKPCYNPLPHQILFWPSSIPNYCL